MPFRWENAEDYSGAADIIHQPFICPFELGHGFNPNSFTDHLGLVGRDFIAWAVVGELLSLSGPVMQVDKAMVFPAEPDNYQSIISIVAVGMVTFASEGAFRDLALFGVLKCLTGLIPSGFLGVVYLPVGLARVITVLAISVPSGGLTRKISRRL